MKVNFIIAVLIQNLEQLQDILKPNLFSEHVRYCALELRQLDESFALCVEKQEKLVEVAVVLISQDEVQVLNQLIEMALLILLLVLVMEDVGLQLNYIITYMFMYLFFLVLLLPLEAAGL